MKKTYLLPQKQNQPGVGFTRATGQASSPTVTGGIISPMPGYVLDPANISYYRIPFLYSRDSSLIRWWGGGR